MRRLLAVSDLVALLVTGVITYVVLEVLAGREFPLDLQLVFLALLPAWTYIASLLRLYHLSDRRLDHSIADEFGPVLLAATVWSWAFLLTRAAVLSGPVDVLPSMTLWVTTIGTVLGLRALTRSIARRRSWYRQRVTVVGTSPDIGRVVRRIGRHPEYALDVVRTVEISEPGSESGADGPGSRRAVEVSPLTGENGEGITRLHAEAGSNELVDTVTSSRVNRVIVASSPGDLEERCDLIRQLVDANVHVDLVSGDPDVFSSSTVLHYVEGLPVLTIPAVQGAKAWASLKRLFDVATSAIALVTLSPLLAYCVVRIKLDSRGPVLFRQRRVGRDGERFELLKFRTMVDGADARKAELEGSNIHSRSDTPGMFKIPSDPRVTRFGAWLRRWSLDELPQLWNVLKGEMSLVGPRPLIPQEAELVSGHYSKRMRMRPGITGPWQTLGRSDIGFADMVKLDYTYVMNWSFAEDIRLLIRTIGAVAEGRGAY